MGNCLAILRIVDKVYSALPLTMSRYMFKISRLPVEDLGTLNLALESQRVYKCSFDDFFSEGYKGVCRASCFALPINDRTKRFKEAELYHHNIHVCGMEENDDDIPLSSMTLRDWESYNSDSDGPDTDDRGFQY